MAKYCSSNFLSSGDASYWPGSDQGWRISTSSRLRVTVEGQQSFRSICRDFPRRRPLFLHSLFLFFFATTYSTSPGTQVVLPIQGRLTISSGGRKICSFVTSNYRYPFRTISEFLISGIPISQQSFEVNLGCPFQLARNSVVRYTFSFYVQGDVLLHGRLSTPQTSSRLICFQSPIQGSVSTSPLSSSQLQDVFQYLEEAFSGRSRRARRRALRRLEDLIDFLSPQLEGSESSDSSDSSDDSGSCSGSGSGSGTD
jgi:hypothetical protein